MRNAYLDTLYELASKDSNVISLISDNGLIVYDDFRERFPKQYFNFGISESHMIAAAAGMATCGKIPFLYTIGSFLAYRAFEFIRDDVCMQNLNVKIIGIGAGMAYSTLGPSHHTTEDLAVLRVLPNLTLFSPASPLEVKEVIKEAYNIQGPVYIRLGTNNEKEIYNNNCVFEMGKASELRIGSDVTLISTGSIISEVLEASNMLESEGISVQVLNYSTIKPFDREAVLQSAKKVKRILSIEEHSVIGGLRGAIAEVIADSNIAVKMDYVGLNDCFGKSYGTHMEVKNYNGLSSEAIYNKAKKLLG